jgi:hypothetical protein
MPMPLSEFIPDDQFFDMRADGKISQKTMLRGLGFISMDEIDAIKDFVAESAGDAENRVAYAKDTGNKDEYNWWCGFAEALGEVMAKIDEISDGT